MLYVASLFSSIYIMVVFIRVFKLDSVANPTQGLSHKFCLDYRVLIGSILIFFINQNDIVLVLKK